MWEGPIKGLTYNVFWSSFIAWKFISAHLKPFIPVLQHTDIFVIGFWQDQQTFFPFFYAFPREKARKMLVMGVLYLVVVEARSPVRV